MLSAAARASLTLPSCSPNYPRASRIGWTHARHCPFLKEIFLKLSWTVKSMRVFFHRKVPFYCIKLVYNSLPFLWMNKARFRRRTSHKPNRIHKSVMECTLISMPFTKETASLHVKPAKDKLHLSAQSSLMSETRHFDALTHNLYYCAYSGLQNTLKIH